MEINGKTALITGGASGLGEATARHFHRLGARVAILDLNVERGQQVVDELGSERAAFFAVDITDGQAVQAVVDAVVDRFGALHVCCNFAGIAPAVKTIGRDGPGDLELFTKVVQINLIGSFNVARLAAWAMAKNEPVDEDGSRGVILHTGLSSCLRGTNRSSCVQRIEGWNRKSHPHYGT